MSERLIYPITQMHRLVTCEANLSKKCLGTVDAKFGYVAMIKGKVAFVCDECAKRIKKGRGG